MLAVMTEEPARKRGRPKLPRQRTKWYKIRALPEWIEWVNQTAESNGQTGAEIIEQAVAAWAAARGLNPPPKR